MYNSSNLNEAETRAEHIDPKLRETGWGVVDASRVRREYHITEGRLQGQGKRTKAEIADYVLVYKNTPLAIIEAKAWDKPRTLGVAQAKGYAKMLGIRFAYATNGQGIYRIDMETGKEGNVDNYPTPDELWNLTFATPNPWRDRFAAVPLGGAYPVRYYQESAIEKALEAISEDKRRILLTLATGTGKTYVAFQIAWKLFNARWKASGEQGRLPRILFLADRNNLADQAFNGFSAFPADSMARVSPDEIRKKGRIPKNASVFFTIFQTFMSGTDAEGNPAPFFGEYPPDFFDFIVIDECHRGGAQNESKWRGILEYFAPAVQLGLTATPKRDVNADTYDYFGEPVYTYSLKQGINDGFLTPFRMKQVGTSIDEYVYTSGDTVMEGEVEEGRRYTEGDFNRTIIIEERERERVKIFLADIDPNEKTLVFCATQNHALMVRDIVNQLKSVPDVEYCVRVTAEDGERGNKSLRDFQDNEKNIPTILTTSQKLTTGVDARNVRNIVLMRPINSIIEFKQIIGRGTRLYEGKDYFTVYDFVKAYKRFDDPDWDGEPVAPEPPKEREPYTPPTGPVPPLPPREKLVIKLGDGKERTIEHTTATTFWDTNGVPMSAQEFLERLYGELPALFKDEAELRTLWSEPGTRKKLLQGLESKGFGREQLTAMQKVIDAEKSDLFDVLAMLAYDMPPLTREERAVKAKKALQAHFNTKQQDFLDFVLSHYVNEGVDELDTDKLTPLLLLKYNDSISDAITDLGTGVGEIRTMFAGFQHYLYDLPNKGKL